MAEASRDNNRVPVALGVDDSTGLPVELQVDSNSRLKCSAVVSGITTSNITASTLVTEADTIAANDNDTTIPTSAAVKDYVDGSGSGDVSKVGTPVDNQVGVWTGNGTIEGTTGLTYDGSNFLLTGDIGATGTRITKGWFTDLAVTNAIAGSVTGNAGTVTNGVYTDQSTPQTIGATGARMTKVWTTDIESTNAPTVGGSAVYYTGGTDVAVADGGTGRSTATAYGVLCGGTTTTGAHQSIASIGTTGQVLTSNGADALPTFQDAGGGGGLAGTSKKTIGTNGDYADVVAFLAGESSPYHGVFVSNVTEDSDIAVPSGASITLDLDRYIYTLAAYQFTYAGAANIRIFGAGMDSGAEIDFTQTADNDQVFENWNYKTSVVDVSDLLIDNHSTGALNTFSRAIEKVRNVRVNCADIATRSGLETEETDSSYDNVWFVGGGTTCGGALVLASANGVRASNLFFSGTYATDALVLDIRDESVVNNVVFNHATNEIRVRADDCALSNVYVTGSVDVNIDINGEAKLTNIDLLGGDVVVVNPSIKATLTNVTTTGAIDDNTGTKFVNCSFDTSSALSGDRNSFTNCRFIGGLSVASGADNNGFINCQFGADAGGGANTLTVDSGANNTRIVGCMTDAAISDSGTGTQVAANVVY